MPQRRVTLAAIAREAGVHVSTVSLAMHNHPRIPEATRQRLQDLAARMGYTPDPMMQALVAYRRGIGRPESAPTIAYVTDWNTRFGWEKWLHLPFYLGAEAKAKETGYKIDHFWVREPGQTHARLSQILQSRGINGVVVASHVRESGEELRLDWSLFSAVKIDHLPPKPRLHTVTNDQLQIVRLACRKLIDGGYRRIGFAVPESWDVTVDHRWSMGFLWAQQSVAPEDRIPIYLVPNGEPFDKWFRRTRPEVVISKHDYVLPDMARMGLRIPEDVAFVDLFLSEPSTETAGMRHNFSTVGAVAIEILAGQMRQNIRGIPEIPTTTFVEGTWFDGPSCPFPQRRARKLA